MINKGLWLCLLYVLLTFSAFASPAPDTRASDYDLVRADNPSEPQVLARVEVPENLQSLNLPVYAGIVDGSGVFYALIMASRNQLDTSGVSYRIIDICPSDVRYLLAFSRNPDHHEKGAFQIPVLYDDGRCIIVRDIDDADNILIDIGFELKLLSVEPMRLEPVEIDKTLAVGAVTPDSDVSKMLSQVDINAVTTSISHLSGASSVTIDGNPYTITTRRTDSGTPIQKATPVVKASLATVAHLAGTIGIIGQITLEAELQKMLDKAITDSTTHTPGAVLLLSTSSAQYAVAGGKSNLSSATAIKATDMLRIASMTKIFLSTVILKLREEGKLNLDDTVAKHLPETAAKIANGQTATIRQLLNMSSGIFEYYDNPDYLKAVETRPSRQAWTPEEVIAYVYDQSAYFSPGTQFKYTNSNYILLEMIVNKVSNATLASEMRRIIFTPLGMDNTFMEMAETRAGGFGGLLVRGYDTTQNPAADITEKNDSLGLGDGGLISDAQGLDTFLRSLFKQKTLLNEDSLSQMKTIGISGKEYGLGLEVKISSDYGTNWGHSGKTAGFQGEMRYFPDKDTTFAILTNEENSNSTFIDDVFKSSMRLLYSQNSITEFSAGITSNSGPWEIATGPDGNLWFTYINLTLKRNVVGKITPSGVVTEFFVDIGSDNRSWGITAGSDGNMWFTAPGYAFSDGMIVRISPSGAVAKFTDGITPLSSPQGITAGPDGNIWFAETTGNRIGRITPSGVVTEFSNGISPNSSPTSIVAGSDGNLWFTEIDGNRIGRITPSGDITEFSVGISPGSGPSRITSGPDGNLWFTESKGNRIGRITPSGVVTEFSAGITPNSQLAGITTGPDGNVWFSEGVGRIGKITTSGVATEFSAGISPNSEALGIVTGPDGNIWFTEPIGNRIGRVSEITTGCTAMLDSSFVLHIPILSNSDSAIGTVSLWADFVYKPDSAYPTLVPLMLTTYGILNHPSFSCAASRLSGNLSIHIPEVLFSDQMTRMWMYLEYSPHLSVSGKNYWYLKNFGVIIK